MTDPSKEKDPPPKDDLLEVDSHYVEVDRKIRRRRIVVIGFTILLVIGLLFFQNIVDLFVTPKKPAGRIEKEAKEKMVRLSEAEWQAFAEKAKAMLSEGKVEEAQQILLKVLGRSPEIAEAHYLAGLTYLRQGRIQSAYDQLRQATTLRADYYEAQEKLGEIYLLAGDYKAAKDVSSRLTKGGEYLQDGLLLESEIALAEGDLEQALQKANAAMMGSKKAVAVKSSTYLADLYLKKGDKSKADQIVKKLDPASMDAEGLLSLAKFYLGAENEAQALSFFKRALQRYPESAEVNYHYGQYLFKKGQYNEAAGYYKKALAVVPSVQIIAYQLTQCLLATGQQNEAKTQIDAMLRTYPNSVLTLGLSFQYHLLAGERRQAIDALNRMSMKIPRAPRPYTILASLYWQEGMIPLAEKNALKAMKLGEKTVLPHLIVGDVLFSKKQYQQALSYYDRVLEVQPDNLVALLQTGDLYLNLGQPKKAEERYQKAATENPRIKSLQTKIAWARAQSGDLEGALAINRQYLQQAPNDHQAVSAYVNTLLLANRLDEAVGIVQKSVQKQPKAWSLHYLLGDLYVLRKDFRAAAASYRDALALNPDDVNLALNVGARYEKNALDTETENYYLKLLAKMPNNPLVGNQLAWFYIERIGAPQKAKGLIEALMMEKDWPEIKDTIGWYYYKTGQFVNAENYLREALRLAPDHHETRARLALTLFSLKKNQEAMEEAQKITTVLTPSPLKSRLDEVVAQQKK